MIRERLQAALAPEAIDIQDRIVSAAFAGKTPIQRHRMVFEALGDAMQTEIHALSIDARTPDEA